MTDADLIYNALLRAEQRLERSASDGAFPQAAELARAALVAAQAIREEIGNGLAREGR